MPDDDWDDFFDEEDVKKKEGNKEKTVSKVQEKLVDDEDISVSKTPPASTDTDWKKEPEPSTNEEFDWGDDTGAAIVKSGKGSITNPVVVTLDNIPKTFLIELHGEPYIGAAGLLYIAKKIGLTRIETEAKLNSWEIGNEKKVARYHAKAHFHGGKVVYEADGIAIPDHRNIKTTKMFPYVDQLAETRAVNRALRRATNYGHPSAEEMADYEKVDI